jgi:hypothetical protein
MYQKISAHRFVQRLAEKMPRHFESELVPGYFDNKGMNALPSRFQMAYV